MNARNILTHFSFFSQGAWPFRRPQEEKPTITPGRALTVAILAIEHLLTGEPPAAAFDPDEAWAAQSELLRISVKLARGAK